ncbi:hypothetical protein AQUCO_00200748v1 [Aquilegia coerulea]|uniref:C2H2-type domain-containing protein n=1 Tax=Aquilegia coerulea TaxID=218851 RepID=A0A2G5F4P2_AQUCA|nr:hypothetical protein AQUCO_00200748v1 [Aquilegia coerulea]
MGLVDYETDNEDGDGDSRVLSSFSTVKGGNMFKPPPPKGGISNALFLENEITWTRSPGEVNASQMTGVLKRKVMSMELAMKRESKYRTKVECLKKQRRDESYQSPKTVQVVSSSTRTTETKKVPATNISRSPPQGVLSTRTVGIKRPPPTNLSGSTPHVKKSDSLESLKSHPPRTMEFKRASSSYQSCMSSQVRQSYDQESSEVQPAKSFRILGTSSANQSCSPPKLRQSHSQNALQVQPVIFCKECNVMCSGALNLMQHYQGKKHKARVEELKMNNGVKMGIEPVMCEVCNIQCMSEYNYREHLTGKKHASCLQAIEASRRLRS